MNRILSTSALTVLLASGAAYAQEQGDIFANVPNDPSMILGTDYIGQSVYSTLESSGEMPAGEAMPTEPAPAAGDVNAEAGTTTQEMTAPQQPQSVGEISDIIMTQDGQLEYVILGVGGFLGIGQQDVAVNFEALSVEPDPQNEGEMMIMISATQEQIENAPEFDRSVVEGTGEAMQTGDAGDTGTMTADSETEVQTEESEPEMETIEPETTTVESTGEEIESEGEEAAAETEDAVEGAANETEEAAEDAGETVSDAADEAVSETGEAVEETGDAIEDVTDEATSSN